MSLVLSETIVRPSESSMKRFGHQWPRSVGW